MSGSKVRRGVLELSSCLTAYLPISSGLRNQSDEQGDQHNPKEHRGKEKGASGLRVVGCMHELTGVLLAGQRECGRACRTKEGPRRTEGGKD